MSVRHQVLQQVVTRMYIDVRFADAVCRGDDDAGLSPDELRLLRAVDPRAFLTDPLRGSRLVHALVEELPVTAAVHGVPAFFAFLASPQIAAALRPAGHLAPLLAHALDDGACGFAAFEAACATARQHQPHTPSAGAVARGAGVVPVKLRAGTLQHYANAKATALSHGVEGLIKAMRCADVAASGVHEYVLLQHHAGDVAASHIAEPVYEVLSAVAMERPRAFVLDAIVAAGAENVEEANDVLNELVSDGLLLQVS